MPVVLGANTVSLSPRIESIEGVFTFVIFSSVSIQNDLMGVLITSGYECLSKRTSSKI